MNSSSGRNCCLPDCCSRSDNVPIFQVTNKRLEEWSRSVDPEYAHSKFLRPYKLKLTHRLCALHFRSEDIQSYETDSLGKAKEKKRLSVQRQAVPVFIRRSDVDLAIMSGKCGLPNMIDYNLLCRLRSIQPMSPHMTHKDVVKPVLPVTAPSLLPCSVLCPECSMAFTTKAELKTHQSSTHHSPFICPVEECQKRFKTAFTLRRHKSLHAGEINKCPVCSKEVRSQSNFNKHLNLHRKRGELPTSLRDTTSKTSGYSQNPLASMNVLCHPNESTISMSESSTTDDVSENPIYPPDLVQPAWFNSYQSVSDSSVEPPDTNSFLDVKIKLEIDNPSDPLEDPHSRHQLIPETEFVKVEMYIESTVKQEEPEFDFENGMQS